MERETMQYDFDRAVNRRNTDSLKWDVKERELPMWVADMDFETAPEIRAAIENRAAHGIYGYTAVPDAWYRAYLDWWENRHQFPMEREWLVFCTGVVPAISSMVRKLTAPAEKVVLLTPVYNIFFNSIQNNGRQALECPLRYDGNAYEINFERLERALSDPQTALLILCNPHNPTGNIWGRDELERIGNLCADHGVLVISDEIHCDLTMPEKDYIPFASVSDKCRDNSITCLAPTKAFNLAGLQTAAVCVPNPRLRHRVWRALNTDEVAEPNVFAAQAAVAAFTKGAPWLDALRKYLFENRKAAEAFLEKEIPHVHAVPSEATYLLWIDCRGIIGDVPQMCDFIREQTGLYLSKGNQFGKGGADFLRMNLACPRQSLRKGLELLKQGISQYEEWAVRQC